eukprot:1159778-Pelagomonas_calceolata.AAC.5
MDKLHPVHPEYLHKHAAQSSEATRSSSSSKATAGRQKSKASAKEGKADAEGKEEGVADMDEQRSGPGAENQHMPDAGGQQAPSALEQLSSFGVAGKLEGCERTMESWL